MLSRRSAVLLLVAGLLIGCQSKAAKQAAQPSSETSEQIAASLRERYQRANPNSRVGIVTAVKADAKLVSVGDIPVQDFGINDVVVFIDAGGRVIASGTVVNATPNALHVRYEATTREPRVGDLVVRQLN